MKHKFLKPAAFCMAMSMLLTGCGYQQAQTDDTNNISASDELDGYTAVTSLEGELTNPNDGVFTLCWKQDEPLNPFVSTTEENAAIGSLLYEGLFDISPEFEAVPCICSDYSVNGLEYTFYIQEGIEFHDGSTVNAYDVRTSLRYAMESERYGSRLSCIESVDYVSELCLKITLKSENATLPLLLDVPIVKRDTEDDNVPTGTGPYKFDRNNDNPKLARYMGYRKDVPIDDVFLYDTTGTKPAWAISQRKVDMMLYDPMEGSLDVYTDCAAIYYNTTIFQYIGFNAYKAMFHDSDVRRAIGHMVNRDAIVSDIFGVSGVTAAPLALSPAAPGYEHMNEDVSIYSPETFSRILSTKGADDKNGDGWLELNGGTLSLKFIVSNVSDKRVEAAKKIASDLQSVGVKVDLNVMSQAKYRSALKKGDFDIYYAEVRLPANFDLSAILSSDGKLNYGSYYGLNGYLNKYLAADTTAEKNIAAASLCKAIYEDAPIIPICYNKNAVAIPRSEIEGVNPSQQNVFWELSDWTVKLGQED